MNSVASERLLFGVNIHESVLRSPDLGLWPRLADFIAEDLGARGVRAAIYCADAVLNPGSPFPGCTVDGAWNDVELVGQIADDPRFELTPLIQVDVTKRADDDAWRAPHYEAFGEYIGRRLGGRVRYFELGNELDVACLKSGSNPYGDLITDYEAEPVERVRTSLRALKTGISRGVAAGIEAGEIPAGWVPQFAFGVAGTHVGLMDAIWRGVRTDDPELIEHEELKVEWDISVVHWYYSTGYGDKLGSPYEQLTGFDNIDLEFLPQNKRNAAALFRSKFSRPLAITEFGVDPVGVAGSEANRAGSFARIAAGLDGLAVDYDISALFAFILNHPHAPGYNLADPSNDYALSSTGIAYQQFLTGVEGIALPHVVSPTATVPVPAGQITISGTGQPGGTVNIRGQRTYTDLGTTPQPIGADGTWEVPLNRSLGRGTYDMIAIQTSDALYAKKSDFSFTTITAVTVSTPALDGVITDTTPLFVGAGEPGARIQVRGNSGRLLCEISSIPGNGQWSGESTVALTPGDYIGTVFQDVQGNQTRAPLRYTVARPLTVTTPTEGEAIPGSRPTYTGTGEPDADIRIRGNSGTTIATTTVGADRQWSTTSTIPLQPGPYISFVTQTINGFIADELQLTYTVT